MLRFPEAGKDPGTSPWEPEAHREPAKRPDWLCWNSLQSRMHESYQRLECKLGVCASNQRCILFISFFFILPPPHTHTLSLGSEMPACVPAITCSGRGLKLTFPRWPVSLQCRTPVDFFFKTLQKALWMQTCLGRPALHSPEEMFSFLSECALLSGHLS